MTHIAYILKMYPRFSETFIVNEILELERQGVDVRIYSLRKPDDGRFHPNLARVKANVVYAPQYPQMEPERVRAAHLAVAAARPAEYAALRAHAEGLAQPFGLKRFLQAGVIAAHLLRQPVDALHAHFASSATRVANMAARLTGIPYSFTAHAKDIFHQEVSPASLQAKMADARFVVTVSRFNQAYLRQIQNGGGGDVRCLYNGVDLRHFKPNPRVAREPGLILSVGRLVEKKGFALLLHACALLAQRGLDFRCQIIGGGEQHAALTRLIGELGLAGHVTLAGPQPQDAVLAAYQRAALFALPCIVAADGNRDGLPTVLLEAMATGLPVVASTVTGNPEIVEHGVDGLLVPPEDAPALADALARLLQDQALRGALGAAARRKVERCFDVRHNVAQLRQWLDEPAAPQPRPAHHGAAQPAALAAEAAHAAAAALPALPAALALEEVLA
ncbi:MAG: glycosyltransferase [Anaerolinea sp.]|nr:glycosyltransferase [Anaerolinea sp.]